MKLSIDEDRTFVIEEVFNGAVIKTEEGNRIGFCLRDDTVELNVLPASGGSRWFRVDMDTLRIGPMNDQVRTVSHSEGSVPKGAEG